MQEPKEAEAKVPEAALTAPAPATAASPTPAPLPSSTDKKRPKDDADEQAPTKKARYSMTSFTLDFR